MKKAIILARVSTPEQQKQGLSIDEIQLPRMRDYAKSHDFEIIEEFIFQETASGKLRKKFDEMIAFIKGRKEIGAIIAFRVDRMTRNYRDAVEMDLLRIKHHKELHFVDDRLVLDENSVGRDIQDWDLKVFLAKQHINRCQEDTKNTIESKLKSGEMYGKAPYGYRNISKEESRRTGEPRVVLEPFEAGVVKKIFDWYTSGAESYLSIAKKLMADYPSKFERLANTKRKIEDIVKNPFYYGMRAYKGELYPHKYETIISQEIFEIAKKVRLKRRNTKDKKQKDNKDHSTYGGFLVCAECGCAFSPDKNRHAKQGKKVKSEYYYYCNNSKRIHSKKPKGTNDHKLTQEIAEVLKQMQIPKKDLEGLVKTLRESHEGKKQFVIEETKHCRQEIDRYQNRIEKAYELLGTSMTNYERNGKRKEMSM